jgi:hypothetical protein
VLVQDAAFFMRSSCNVTSKGKGKGKGIPIEAKRLRGE